jgi:hypothetical protein
MAAIMRRRGLDNAARQLQYDSWLHRERRAMEPKRADGHLRQRRGLCTMSLNGWQRIGVVASVAWAVGFYGYAMSQQNWATTFYGMCMRIATDAENAGSGAV